MSSGLPIAAGLAATALFVALAYRLRWQWTGLPAGEADGRPAKTLWDWLGLLGIPLVLAILGFALSEAQDRRDRRREDQREAQQRARATDAEYEATLKGYLDQISELMLDRGLLRSARDADVRDVARTATLTAVRRLDSERRGLVVRFLAEAGLLTPVGPQTQRTESSGVELVPTRNGLRRLRVEAVTIEPGKDRYARVRLSSAELSGALLRRARLRRADLRGATLTGADMFRAQLGVAQMRRTKLAGANLRGADFEKTDLSEAILDRADLTGAFFFETDLSHASLKGAAMNDASLTNVDLLAADLRGADLRDAGFTGGVEFYGANLGRAKLSGANLFGADFRDANLSGADLSRTDLRDANLSGAKLTGAIVTGADLRGARGANLKGAHGKPAHLP